MRWISASAPRHRSRAETGVHTFQGRYFGLDGNVEISTSTKLESHPRGAWWVAKTALILVAIFLFTLTVAAVEVRLGITPSDDSATAWVLSGE